MPVFARMWTGYARQALDQIEGVHVARNAVLRTDSVDPRGGC
jgi:hypothetical protein